MARDLHTDFGALRRAGLEQAQETSREIWSDYNLHDPGVTLLEQTCYALGELAYRAELPIRDLLTAPDGTLDHEALALPHPRAVLASAPVTLTDLELRLGSLPGVSQVSLVQPKGQQVGLVDVVVLPAMDTLEKDAAQRVGEVFHSERPLGLALRRLTIARPMLCLLSAEIEIDPGSSAEEVVARIFHLAKRLTRYPEAELPEFGAEEADRKGPTRNAVFDAPELLLGRPHQRQGVRKVEQALRSTIFRLPGVKEAHSIQLHPVERDLATEAGTTAPQTAEEPSSRALVTLGQAEERATGPRTQDAFIRVLMPTERGKIDLRVHRAGEDVQPYLPLLVASLERLQAEEVSDMKTLHADDDWELPGPGRVRALAHAGIDQDLPSAYSGAGSALWGSTRAEAERAFAPLRGYRSLIDQVVASMTADLKSLPGILAGDGAGARTPASRAPGWSYAAPSSPDTHDRTALPQNSPSLFAGSGASPVRRDDPGELMQALLGPTDVASAIGALDPWVDRRCRALDYLLALQGEEMPDGGTAGENAYVLDGEEQIARLKRRVRLLNELPALNRSRGCGGNILHRLPNRAGHRGFLRKLVLVLDLPNLRAHSRPLSAALAQAGLKIRESAEDQAGFGPNEFIVPHDPLDMLPVCDNGSKFVRFNRLKDEIPFLSSGRVRPAIVCAGARFSNYVMAPTWGGKWRVLLDYQGETLADCGVTADENGARDSTQDPSRDTRERPNFKQDAIDRANQVHRSISRLLRFSEGFHCVEHMLLGVAGGDSDPRRLSLIFTGWTPRFQDDDFRQFVREQVDRLAPAHLVVKCFFADAETLERLENVLARWRALMARHARLTIHGDGDLETDLVLVKAARTVASELRKLEAAV